MDCFAALAITGLDLCIACPGKTLSEPGLLMRQGASGLRICLHNAAMPRSSQILAHAAGALPAPGEWQSARPVPLLANLQRLTAPNPGFMTGPGTNSYLVGDAATGYFVIDPGPADGEHIARLWDAARHADGSGGHIQAIVCTHSHADHSPGAAPLQALCTQRSGHSPPIWGLPSAPTARANSHFVPDQVLAHGALLQLQAEGAPQHTLMAISFGVWGSYCHSCAPVLAS